MRARALLAAGLALGLSGPARAGSPGVDYALHCMGCHRADGRGTGDIPALADYVGNFPAVPRGRAFLVRVPGVAQSALGDADLAGVLNWVLLEFSPDELPADFAPYTADEVGRLRQQPLVDVERERAALVRRIEGR